MFANSRKWKFFDSTILIPFVKELSIFKNYGWLAPTRWEIFSDILLSRGQRLNDSNVAVGKPPCGIAASTQPCNRGDCFNNIHMKKI